MRLKNRVIKTLIKYISPFISKQTGGPKRILAISTTALGDTIWATPALESLKASFPEAYIAALTSPIGAQALLENPWTDKIYTLKEPLFPCFFQFWKRLSREKFDTILIFHSSERLILPLASLLGANTIVGTKGIQKGLDELLTHPLENSYQHEISRRLKMVEAIGGKIHSETLSFPLTKEEKKVSLLSEGRWVFLHPGSKDGFKRWPLENFAVLGNRLQKELGVKILITGTKEEADLVASLKQKIEGAETLPQNLSLRPFAALLEKADLLISNDTGPVHIACALNRPVIGIYVSTDPKLCGPYKAKNGVAISKTPTCTPCLKRKCRRPFCFMQISPDEVFEKAASLLKKSLT